MRRILLAGLALAMLLTGCGNSSLLAPDDSDVTIKSALNGQTISPAEAIVFAVSGGGSGGPDRVTVTVTSADGATVSELTIDDPQPGKEVSLDLAPLGGRPGQYRARFAVLDGGAVIGEKSLVFFVGPQGLRANGIESRPSLISAGASVELSVDLTAPEGVDPYLRWTENRRLLAAGAASSGGARVSWKAPREPGVYTIGVEVFPVAPVEGAAFAHTSSIRTSTELYVSPQRPVRSLGPPASYWMLYGFDGSLADATRASIEAHAVGTIVPAAVGDSLGYRLTPPSGIRIAQSLVPPGDAGFTISLGLTLTEGVTAARMLASRAGEREISLVLGDDGAPRAVLRWEGGQAQLESGLPPLRPGDRHHLDLSLSRASGTLAALWFLDGEPGAAVLVGGEPLLPPVGTGETLIGGAGGVAAVIDELGVYYRDAAGRPGADPGVYLRAMAARYGEALLLADGFDGEHLDPGYLVQGSASVSLGRLVLGPSSSVELALRRPASGDILLEAVADRELAVKWLGETLRLTAGAPRPSEERVRVRIRPREGAAAGAEGYRLVIASGADGPLSLASLMARVD